MAAPVELTILHTNDIHGHILPWHGWQGEMNGQTIGGFDRLAAVVAQVRSKRANVLLLDAGDTISDTMIAAESKGSVVTDLMNVLRYDAMTIGNHEPDFGPEVLRERIAGSRFAVIASNVQDRARGALLTNSYIVKDYAGVRVGILGISYPKTPLTTARKNVEGLEFGEAAEAAAMYIPAMKKESAGIVVVLSHLGLNAEKHLAETVPEIDVIVGGHSHNRMREPIRVGRTLIVQAGAHLSDVGRLDLTIDGGKIVRYRRDLILLDNTKIQGDPNKLSRTWSPKIRQRRSAA